MTINQDRVNTDKMNEPRRSTMPNEVINAISEHSPAGFILFAIDEQGKPEIYTCYDSDVSALALHKFALLWSEVTQDVQATSMFNMITHEEPEDTEDTSGE